MLKLIDESELSESVFNSNAIENSTLTLKETERILMEMEVSRNVSVREVFEAKNLARVLEYIRSKSVEPELSIELILLLHKMLMGNINDAYRRTFPQKRRVCARRNAYSSGAGAGGKNDRVDYC